MFSKLAIKDKNHPVYTSEVLDVTHLITVYVKLLLAQYYACIVLFLCISNNRLAWLSTYFLVFMSTVNNTQKVM